MQIRWQRKGESGGRVKELIPRVVIFRRVALSLPKSSAFHFGDAVHGKGLVTISILCDGVVEFPSQCSI